MGDPHIDILHRVTPKHTPRANALDKSTGLHDVVQQSFRLINLPRPGSSAARSWSNSETCRILPGPGREINPTLNDAGSILGATCGSTLGAS